VPQWGQEAKGDGASKQIERTLKAEKGTKIKT